MSNLNKDKILGLTDKLAQPQHSSPNRTELEINIEMLSGILNNRLDDIVSKVNAEISQINGNELSVEIIEEVKLLISTLPQDLQGYSAVVGDLFEVAQMVKSFPSRSDVERNQQRYDSVFGDWDGEREISYGAIVSIIPKSKPEGAILFNRVFIDIKNSAKQRIAAQLLFHKPMPPTLLVNKVMDSIYSDFTANFLDVEHKDKSDEIFSLKDLDKLQEFFKMKNNHYTKDVLSLSLWMKASCEKYQLENSVLGCGTIKSLGIKETLKV